MKNIMKSLMEINSDAISLRKDFGIDMYSPINVFPLLMNLVNLTVAFYPMGDNISGACFKSDSQKLIVINSNSTYGRQRFTAGHELCHLFFHEQLGSVICPNSIEKTKDVKEKEADKFASYFLAPDEALKDFIFKNIKVKNKEDIDINHIVTIEQHFGLSRMATLQRLIDDNYLSHEKAKTMKKDVILSALKLGFDIKLYLPSPEEQKYSTYGQYIKFTEELKNKELVSDGKYEELLLDAYRSDIVFGLDEQGSERYD